MSHGLVMVAVMLQSYCQKDKRDVGEELA